MAKRDADIKSIRDAEKLSLLHICELLEEKGKPNFEKNSNSDFGIVQGALRTAYDLLRRFIQSPYLELEKRGKLEVQGERVFKIRDTLVKAVEGNGEDFIEVATTDRTHQKVGEVIKTLRDYISQWYQN